MAEAFGSNSFVAADAAVVADADAAVVVAAVAAAVDDVQSCLTIQGRPQYAAWWILDGLVARELLQIFVL